MINRTVAGVATSAMAVALAATPAATAFAAPAPATTPAKTAHASASGAVSLRIKDRKRHYNGLMTSLNWAGYAQTGASQGIHSVSSSFVVPKVGTQTNGYASTWVGIDGYANGYLTQVGIAEEMLNGKATYYGWWEVITPNRLLPEQRFALAMKPGQYITATVTTTHGRTTMSLWNRTTNRRVWHITPYAGPGASAEWIQEDVYVNGVVSRAPRWGRVDFTASTKNGKNPKFDYKQSIDILDSHGVRETDTHKPNRSGNAFAVFWKNAGNESPMM